MYQIAVILTDARRRILWVNEDFTATTGYSHEEAIGCVPSNLLQEPLPEKEAIAQVRDELRNASSVEPELSYNHKSDGAYPLSMDLPPVFSEKRTGATNSEVANGSDKSVGKVPNSEVEKKYHSSSLQGIDELKLYSRIRSMVANEQLYLDPNLSLRTLANRLDTNTKYLSQVVNHCSGYNFQQFVNTYRIQSVKARLAEGAHNTLTLFGVAQQCGFKNKSTFYKVFKDITKLTPKEYLGA